MNANDKAELDADETSLDTSSAASSVVNYLIDEHHAKSGAIESLKQSVFEWVEAVIGINNVADNKLSLPAFVFIDELDRCRPSYAVEMLETIKHIFDIKGVVFVIATDTEQLQHTVKAVYGEGFNAKIYLGRFFNSRYSLKAPNLESFLDVHSDISKFSGSYLSDIGVEILPINDDPKVTLRNIAIIMNAFSISARTAIQIADRIVATIVGLPKNAKLDILMLTMLLCVKEKDSDLFDEIVKGNFERKVSNGDKTRVIHLAEFIESKIVEKYGRELLNMAFDPQLITSTLKIKRHYSPVANLYAEGIYTFTLMEYINTIFSEHLAHSYTAMDFVTSISSSRMNELSDIEMIGIELNNAFNSDKPKCEQGGLWMKYLYIDKKYESISNDHYKDLVELASPLDWMGEDELT